MNHQFGKEANIAVDQIEFLVAKYTKVLFIFTIEDNNVDDAVIIYYPQFVCVHLLYYRDKSCFCLLLAKIFLSFVVGNSSKIRRVHCG
jgi:hypothetical protein